MKQKKLHVKPRGERFEPYLLLLPTIILFAIFTYYPFVKGIHMSFTLTDRAGNITRWVGLANFERLFKRADFAMIMQQTMIFAAIVCFGTIILATLLALLCTRERKWCRSYQTMYSVTMSIASVPASAMWLFILRLDGLLNMLLQSNVAWLQNPDTALVTVALVTVWLHTGSSFLFLLVGFRNVPEELLESAKIDGAGSIRRTFHVIFPISSPQIFFVLFMNIISSFKAFGQIKLLTGGGPANRTMTIIYAIYKESMYNGRFETACAYSLILFVVIFLITRIQFLLEKKVVFYQ